MFGHGFTTGGHPVATAVALENLKIIEERDLVGNVRRLGPRLQVGLRRAEIAALSVEDLHQNRRFDSLRIVRKADAATRSPPTRMSHNASAPISMRPATPAISRGRCSVR